MKAALSAWVWFRTSSWSRPHGRARRRQKSLSPCRGKKKANVVTRLHLINNYSVGIRPKTRTVILRATLSSCDASSLILWTILSNAPPSCRGSDRWAKALLPQTKCNWTAAVSFFSASRPCHTIGYFCLNARENKDKYVRQSHFLFRPTSLNTI